MKSINNQIKFKTYIKNESFKKIFIITGVNSFNKSGAKQLIAKDIIKKTKIYYKKNSIPEIKELTKIVTLVKKYEPNIIIAMGGGAVIDYGKIVSVINNVKRIKNLIIRNNIPKKKSYPLIAIPTTSGSGAEVTPNAIIYINKTKYTVDKKIIQPNKYFLIPKLTLSGTKKIKASSGFDAIAQSIESLLSVRSNKRSVFFATKSLKYSLRSYIDFVNRPSYFNAEQMLTAANISGKAIAISKTTAPHAISYPFTAHFGIPHGHAVSLSLDKILMFNYLNIKAAKVNFSLQERYNLIFKLTKTKNINELILFVKNLKKLSNLEDDFKILGINLNKHKDKILAGINNNRLTNNPVKIKVKDILSIIS